MSGSLLVILPHNPGDVVMALQAIRRAKAALPDVAVDYLVSEECRGLVEGSPLIRRVFPIPKRALRAHWDSGDDTGLLKALEAFLEDLRATRYALSANLYQERAGGLLQGFVNADRKIGLEFRDGENFRVGSRYLEHLFAIPADRAGNPWHVVDIYARALLRALGDPGSASAPQGPDHPAQVTALLPPLSRPDAARGLTPGAYLAVHPGSAWAGKRWPEAHWSGLIERCASAGLPFALTGSPEEKPLAARILASLSPAARNAVTDCCGATTLIGSAWIHAHARLTITGDTVAMHLAAASGTPTLCLFGASNPVETGPYGRGHVIIETDPRPRPDLALAEAHPGLTHLLPREVAAWILAGELPGNNGLWETGWDSERGMQILRDRRRSPHPTWQRGRGLARVLHRCADREAGLFVHPAPDPGSPRGRLLRVLSEAGTQAPGWRPPADYLARLEAAEKDLGEETRNQLVWEAYRIAVNGLSLRYLGAHLAARKARLEQALGEEALAQGD